jgi:hypothetical protein
MIDHATRYLTRTVLGGAGPVVLLVAASAAAQPAPAAPPAAAPAAPAPAAAAPAAAAPAAAAPEAAPPVAAEPAPTTAVAPAATAAPSPVPLPPLVDAAPAGAPPPVPPAAPEEKKPEFKLTTGLGLRYGMQLEGLRDARKMNTVSVDEIYAEPRFSGQVLGFVGWTANLAVHGITHATVIGQSVPPPEGPPVAFEARAMDLIAQLDFIDEFHVWGGRMLTASDRTNFSGPWFISPWDYPGVYKVPGRKGALAYVGPRGTEEIGREVGTTVWGDIGKGKFKYYLGAMDLDDAPSNTPLWTGRLAYAFVGAEPGFYGSSTYYGAQNIVALGVAAQYQNRFAPAGGNAYAPPDFSARPSDDVFEFNADLLAEMKVGKGGAATLEGAFYHVDSGKSAQAVGVMPFDNAWFVVASYLTGALGPGKLQPLFRYQGYQDKRKVDVGGASVDLPTGVGSIFDGELNYVMKDYFAKLSLGYQLTYMDNTYLTAYGTGSGKAVGRAIQFGFQIQQ